MLVEILHRALVASRNQEEPKSIKDRRERLLPNLSAFDVETIVKYLPDVRNKDSGAVLSFAHIQLS